MALISAGGWTGEAKSNLNMNNFNIGAVGSLIVTGSLIAQNISGGTIISTGTITAGDNIYASNSSFSGANVFAGITMKAPIITGTQLNCGSVVAPLLSGTNVYANYFNITSGVMTILQTSTNTVDYQTVDTGISGTTIEAYVYAGRIGAGSDLQSPIVSGGLANIGSVLSPIISGLNVYGATISGTNLNIATNANLNNAYADTFSGTNCNVSTGLFSTIRASGAMLLRRTSTNTSYTTTANDLYIAQTGTTGSAITLGSVTNQIGRFVIVKDEGGNATAAPIPIIPQAGTVDGIGSVTISTNYNSYRLLCGSPNWFTV